VSNAARLEIPGSGDLGKVAVFDETGDAWDLSAHSVTVVGLVENDEDEAAANTAAIQAAVDAANAASANRTALTGAGSDGGSSVVLLPPGNFYVDRSTDTDAWYCIMVRNAVTLRGSGWGTRLTLKSGVVTTTSEDGGSGNACSVIWFEDPSSFAGVEDLLVDGNKAGQSSTNAWSAGVDMRRDNVVEMYDGGLWLDHVMAWGCLGHGIMAGFAGGSHGNTTANTATIANCYAYHNDGHGFFLKTDQRVT
jgi:hypothetical protein